MIIDSSVSSVQTGKSGTEILTELGIISEKDIEKGGNITTLEALRTIHRIMFDESEPTDTSVLCREWYRTDILAPLDDIDEDIKHLYTDLYFKRNSIVTFDEVPEIDLEADLTEYKAPVYITRLVGDTGLCVDYPEELDFTEKSQTYDAAFGKGLIKSNDMENSDSPILRGDFYEILGKSVLLKRRVGGYAPSVQRYYDKIKARGKEKESEEDEEMVLEKIDADVVIGEDLSVSWTFSDGFKPQKDYGNISTICDGQQPKSFSSMWGTAISGEKFVALLVECSDEKPTAIRISYPNYDTNVAYYFDIPLDKINVTTEGNELSPDLFLSFKGEWVPKEFNLKNGQTFKTGRYYALVSFEHTYRLPELNSYSVAVFKVDKETNTYDNADGWNFGVGVIYLDDIHIQEITVNGNEKDGFEVSMSPLSSEKFVLCKE